MGDRRKLLQALAVGCCSCLLLLAASVQAQGASQSASAGGGGGGLVINEIMSSNKNSVKDSQGDTPAWIELYNGGGSAVNLGGGYSLSEQGDGGNGWAFPAGTTLPPGQYLLVFLSKRNSSDPSELHASFGLGPEDTFIGLFDSGTTMVSGGEFPVGLPSDTSFGVIGNVGAVIAQDGSAGPRYAVLASPTPGAANSGPKQGLGPLVLDTTRSGKPRPDGSQDIAIKATVLEQSNPIDKVELVYVIGYGSETSVPMAASDGSDYTATIPKSAAVPGALVRWFVRATDSVGQATRDPPFATPEQRQYWGTIVADTSDSASLPVIELYCKDEKAPFNPNVVPGCSLWVNGSFYDNLNIGRRGVTSMAWPKPKFKIDAGKQGRVIKIASSLGKVNELNFNSDWSEPGENSFMREPLTWQTFKEMGVEALTSFHMHMRMNGKYYGKFAYVEQLDEDSIQNWGYSDASASPGPLWKSTSGEFSNLRWDIPRDQIQFYWKKFTRKGAQYDGADQQGLLDFAAGLAGGGSMRRSAYLFQAVDLPQVINHMAAQTLLLNQDRCTKNFYIYMDPKTKMWSMFPWDVESAYSIDRGLGGQPAPDYCLLACEQWNSPLACDHNHPQDLVVSTPWGLISAQYDQYQTGRRRRLQGAAGGGGRGDLLAAAGRKLLQGGGGDSGEVAPNGAAAPSLSLPANSTIVPDYDADLTKKGPTVTGAPGTYNYLIDAILSVPRTRAMYVRRLRSLMDQFITTGRLEQLVTAMYNEIKDEARRDIQQWGNPGNVDNGYKQLITEQLPTRKKQLFETYSQSGPIPLIPDSQQGGAKLTVASVDPSAGVIEVSNPNSFAVDVSGYTLSGGVSFTFRAGTVVLPGESVFVAADPGALLASRPGQGLLVVGPYSGQLLGKAAAVTVSDASGATVGSA